MLSTLLGFSKEDSLFIYRPSKVVITPNVLFQDLELRINGAHSSIVSFEPGQTVSAGVTLSYKWFVGSLYYGVYNELEDDLKDKSAYLDFRFNFTKRRGGLDVYIQWYKGFSIKEPPRNSEGSLVDFSNPNLDLMNSGFNFYYSLNKEHSVQSVYKYNELQKKSGGTFLVGLSHHYTRLRFSNSIFPDDIVNEIEMLGERNDGKFLALIPTVGYQFNLVKNKFNISPTLQLGLGLQHQSYMSDAKGDFNGFNRAIKFNFNMPIGVNNLNNYYGIVGRYDKSIFYLERGIDIHFNLISIKAFFGFRF